MAQLIQMRQRIAAIKAIKKITHAMRLISMSTHSRLKGKEAPLSSYISHIKNLFYSIKAQTPTWQNNLVYPTEPLSKNPLIIIIGSQKGLCGNFNSALFKLFELRSKQQNFPEVSYIVVGKKAVDYLNQRKPKKLVAAYPTFSSATLSAISSAITDEIMSKDRGYTNVIFFSNKLKTFFVQKPKTFQLIPFADSLKESGQEQSQEFDWELEPSIVLDALAHQYAQSMIQEILFQSLLAEQAARFLSMDSSTRNATDLLDATQLQYNKLRQAKITKELTELTGSF